MIRIRCHPRQVCILLHLKNLIFKKAFFFSRRGQTAESTILVASLREVIKNQAREVETLEKRVKDLSSGNGDVSFVFFRPVC